MRTAAPWDMLEWMEIFIATTAAIAAVGAVVGAVAGLYSAVGVHRVERKLDTLTGRVDEQGETLRSHVNAPGLHRTA